MKKEYLVKTREDYDDLMMELEIKGYRWNGGQAPTKYDAYDCDNVVIFISGMTITYSTETKEYPNAKLYTAKKYYCLDITEDQMREICHCPRGYMMNIKDDVYSPYRIGVDGYVRDKDFDRTSFNDFLRYNVGEIIEIVPEQPAVEEMTMEQICKALGKTIKIVKE